MGHGLLSGEYSKPASADGEQQPDQKVKIGYGILMMCVLHEGFCVLRGDEERTLSEDMSWGSFQGPVT